MTIYLQQDGPAKPHHQFTMFMHISSLLCLHNEIHIRLNELMGSVYIHYAIIANTISLTLYVEGVVRLYAMLYYTYYYYYYYLVLLCIYVNVPSGT